MLLKNPPNDDGRQNGRCEPKNVIERRGPHVFSVS